MDLVVDLNFRMDTSALYSDIVLPAATWYEKADLQLHRPRTASFTRCRQRCPRAGSRRATGKSSGRWPRSSANWRAKHFPETGRDLVATPLRARFAAEIAQPQIRRLAARGKCEPFPARPCRRLKVVTRDYKNCTSSTSLSGRWREPRLGPRHALRGSRTSTTRRWGVPTFSSDGTEYLSLAEDEQACNIVLRFATVTNGELAYRAYQEHGGKGRRCRWRISPRGTAACGRLQGPSGAAARLLNSPMWSGLTKRPRLFTIHLQHRAPGAVAHADRPAALLSRPPDVSAVRRAPALYKPKPLPSQYADLRESEAVGPTKMLNYLTPHGSGTSTRTYGDNQRMTTLSRGVRAVLDERSTQPRSESRTTTGSKCTTITASW